MIQYYRKEIITPLRGFFAVVEENFNVRKAAEKMHVSTAAIHQQIKALEDALGYEVFSRDKRVYALSEAGKILYHRTAPIIQKFDTVVDSIAKEVNEAAVPEIRLAGHSTAISYLLPRIISKFSETDNTNAKIIIHDDVTRDQATEMLRDNQLDLLIYPSYEMSPEYESIHITFDEAVLAMLRTHPLAEKETISLEDIAKEQLFYINEKYMTLPSLRRIISDYNWHSNIEFKHGTWENLLHYVRAGLGIAFVSTLCVSKDDPMLITRSLSQYFPKMPYSIITKKGTYFSKSVKKFINAASALNI